MRISGQDLIVNLSIVLCPFFSRMCLLLREFEGRLGFLKQRWPYYLGFPGSSVKNSPAVQETQVQSLGREDLLEKGEGSGNPLQYSCLENPIDRGAWPYYLSRKPWEANKEI